DYFSPELEDIIENGYLEDNYEQCQTSLKNSKINKEDKNIALLLSIKLSEPNQLSTSKSTLHVVDFQYLLHFCVDNVLTPALKKS
ncbi:8121_t:CDS:2, partial [Scutellospora calospora]